MTEAATSPIKSFHKNMHWVKNQELFAREDLLIYLNQTHPRLEEPDPDHEYLNKMHPICGSATGGYCCCRGKSDFAKYGAGIVLYFKYLKYFASIFLIASIFFSIPCMVLYYGKGPLTNEAGNFFNNFLSATTIANIGSGTKLLVEATENKTIILNCPEGSILTGITALYGEPVGQIDCPAIQQPNSNGKCFETFRNGTCPDNHYCYLARHPTSNSKCCYRTPEGLGNNEYENEKLKDTKCNSTFASYVINGLCNGYQTCSVDIFTQKHYSWPETENTPCVPSIGSDGDICYSELFGPNIEEEVCDSDKAKRIIVTASCYSKEVIGPVSVTISKSFVVYFISILDFVLYIYILLYIYRVAFLFIMWYWFKVAETSAAAQANKITCTVKDYSVIITNLPKHQSIAQLYFWLKTHFDHLLKSYDHPVTGELLEHGRIADINFGYKTEGVGIQLYTKRGSLLLDFQTLDIKEKGLGDWDLTELRACAKERKKLENKLRILDAQIDVWESLLKARAAFVTFENEEACIYIKEIYSTSFHCCNKTLGELSLQNTNIKVNETVDPTDVKWENIGVSPCSACCRSLFTAIISIIMIIISFIIIYIAKIYQGKLTDEYDSVDCSIFPPSRLTLVDVVLDVFPVELHQTVGNTGKLGCFCWNYFLKSPTSVTGQVFSVPKEELINEAFIEQSRKAAYINNNTFDMNSNHDKWSNSYLTPWIGGDGSDTTEKLCGNYVSKLALSEGLTFVSVLAVLIINTILTQCIYALIRFERKKSGSGELASLVVKIFISQFLNTAIILLLVNMNLERFDVHLEIFDGFSILGGQWDFFSIKWYSVIGVSIIITMIINIASGIASPIIGFIMKSLFICYDRGFSFDPFVTRQKTLTDLEAIYTGKVFFLEQSYAWTLNTMYVCLMYSLGCPFLLIVLFCAFMIKYWADKIGFLRVYRTPDKFDSSLPQYVTTIIPWSLLVHVILSCIIFSDNLAFQEDPGVIGVVSENEVVGAITDFFDDSDLKFISQLITHVPHLVVLFVLLVLYAIFVIISKLVSCKCCKRNSHFYKGLGSYYDKLSLNFLGRALKTNYVKIANIEKWEELFEKKRSERKQHVGAGGGEVSPTDYDDDDEDDIEYGGYMTGIPTYDLCDNTKFQNAFSLNLDSRFFNVRAPIDVLAESFENQRQRDEDMLILKKGEYSAQRVSIIEKLFATADLYDEDETTITDLALAIERALPEITYNTCCCSKPPKTEDTICYKIASQIYDICDLDPSSYLNLSYWVNEMYHFTEDYNQFEFATFQSILNPAIKSDLTPYIWDLINKNNEFEAGTGRFKANVQAASIELVNGDYSCIGRRNGGCVFFKKSDECSILFHRVFFKDSYVWRFTQILSNYEPENDDTDPVIVDRHEYLYQAKEMLSIGIPPQGGYAYTNPHDTDVLPPLVHIFGQEETRQAKKVNDEKRKRLEKAKEKLEDALNESYRKIDENAKNIEILKDTCIQQENGISILLKQLRDLGDTTAMSTVPLRFMEEKKNQTASSRNLVNSSRRGSVSDKRLSVRSIGAISPNPYGSANTNTNTTTNTNSNSNSNNNSTNNSVNSNKNTPSTTEAKKKVVVGTALQIPPPPADTSS